MENASPVSVTLTRHMMWRLAGGNDPLQAHLVDSAMGYARGISSDAKEGVTSFLERRPAAFPGKVSTDLPTGFPWWGQPDD